MHVKQITHRRGRLTIHPNEVDVLQEMPLVHIADSAIRHHSIPHLYILVIKPPRANGRIYFVLFVSLVSNAMPDIATSGYWNILIYRHMSHIGIPFSLLNRMPVCRLVRGSHRYHIYNDPTVASREILHIPISDRWWYFFFIADTYMINRYSDYRYVYLFLKKDEWYT